MAQALSILVSASPGERRTALLRDDELLEAWVERPARPDGVGDIYRGRVTALAPAMAGAFVLLAGGETGFLPESEAADRRQPIGKQVSEGQVLALRVTRAAQGGKGPRVSARNVSLPPGSGPPALLARGPSAAERLAARHPQATVSVDEAGCAAELRARLGERVALLHRPAFDALLEGEFAALAEPEVPLPGGGRLLIHPTPALTAIDVDAGGATLREVNAAAIAEAARQIRLRNLAGAILLDIAGLSVKQRAALEETLRAALVPDKLAQLAGLGPLGLFEIRRQRVHPPLHEVLAGPLTPGLAALRRAAREAAANPGRPLALRAHPRVLAALRALPEALEALPLALREDAALAPGEEVIDVG